MAEMDQKTRQALITNISVRLAVMPKAKPRDAASKLAITSDPARSWIAVEIVDALGAFSIEQTNERVEAPSVGGWAKPGE